MKTDVKVEVKEVPAASTKQEISIEKEVQEDIDLDNSINDDVFLEQAKEGLNKKREAEKKVEIAEPKTETDSEKKVDETEKGEDVSGKGDEVPETDKEENPEVKEEVRPEKKVGKKKSQPYNETYNELLKKDDFKNFMDRKIVSEAKKLNSKTNTPTDDKSIQTPPDKTVQKDTELKDEDYLDIDFDAINQSTADKLEKLKEQVDPEFAETIKGILESKDEVLKKVVDFNKNLVDSNKNLQTEVNEIKDTFKKDEFSKTAEKNFSESENMKLYEEKYPAETFKKYDDIVSLARYNSDEAKELEKVGKVMTPFTAIEIVKEKYPELSATFEKAELDYSLKNGDAKPGPKAEEPKVDTSAQKKLDQLKAAAEAKKNRDKDVNSFDTGVPNATDSNDGLEEDTGKLLIEAKKALNKQKREKISELI